MAQTKRKPSSTMERKLIVIGIISMMITAVLYFLDSDQGYPGFSGFLKTLFECALMSGMIFLVLAINFFALSFVVKRLRSLFV